MIKEILFGFGMLVVFIGGAYVLAGILGIIVGIAESIIRLINRKEDAE